jgi:hypothetical protein
MFFKNVSVYASGLIFIVIRFSKYDLRVFVIVVRYHYYVMG